MEIKAINYQDNSGKTLKGKLFIPDNLKQNTPGVLLAHDWSGCGTGIQEKAKQVAALGYISFAIDMYGDGATGVSVEDKMALMQPLTENRALLQARINAAYQTLAAQPQVDISRIAAIGYCFGGLCVLDLARTNADVKGVVSLHGLLNSPDNVAQSKTNSKILVLHGYDDPMVPPEALLDFAKEMKDRQADWQLHAYGQVLHAFTNPEANDPNLGIRYDATADRRSWISTQNFLTELFEL